MTSKIDIRMVFQDHFFTMKDEATGRISKLDIFTMFIVPVLLSLVSFVLCFQIPDVHVGTLISVFSIMAGLLFNVLVLIYSVSDQTGTGANKATRDELLRQTFSNISYTILICLVSVAALCLLLFLSDWMQILITSACVFLISNFIFSILMVLKRLHVLLRSKFPAV